MIPQASGFTRGLAVSAAYNSPVIEPNSIRAGVLAADLASSEGVAVYPSGIKAWVKCPGLNRGRGGGPRSVITSFTPASRRRFRDRIRLYDWVQLTHEKRVAWITLTARTGNPQEFKQAFDNLRRRFQRKYPPGRWWFIWRLEFQKRGAPHFHIILVGPNAPAVTRARLWWVSTWLDVAGHLGAEQQAQDARIVKGMWGIASYVADASKVQQGAAPVDVEATFTPIDELDNDFSMTSVELELPDLPLLTPGRWWGVRGENKAARVACVYLEHREAYYQCKRFIRRLRKARYKQFGRRYRYKPKWQPSDEFLDTSDLWALSAFVCGYSTLQGGFLEFDRLVK